MLLLVDEWVVSGDKVINEHFLSSRLVLLFCLVVPSYGYGGVRVSRRVVLVLLEAFFWLVADQPEEVVVGDTVGVARYEGLVSVLAEWA